MVMLGKAFMKDILRTIYKSKARFLSIFIIIAIGVGFYGGVNAIELDMVLSADTYYKKHRLSDFRIISPLGFTEEDLSNVVDLQGIGSVQEGFSKDLFLTSAQGETFVVKLFSYGREDYIGNKGLNKPVIKEGRLPRCSGEMVVEHGINVPEHIKVGSQVTLSLAKDEELEEVLRTNTFTVVGMVESPLYISFERGQTHIGDGSIDFFAYIPEGDFALEQPTDLFIQTSQSRNLTAYTGAYREHLKPIGEKLEVLGKEAIGRETHALRQELYEGKQELEEKKRKAERELGDAERRLRDAWDEILRGENELEENRIKYQSEIDDGRRELEEGRVQLEDGRRNYLEYYEAWLKGLREYNEREVQLNDAKSQLDRAGLELEQGEEVLAQAKAELDQGKAQLDLLDQGIVALENLRDQLSEQAPGDQEEFNRLVDSIEGIPPEIAEYLKESIPYSKEGQFLFIAMIDAILSDLNKQYQQGMEDYQRGLGEYKEGLEEFQKQREKYQRALKEYEEGHKALEEGKEEIDRGKRDLDRAKADLSRNEKALLEGEGSLDRAQLELEESINQGRLDLERAKEEWAEGWETFEREKKDVLKRIQEAQEEIRDAERQILEIPDGWFVLDREGNPGYANYGDDAERIGVIAKVFPLFFFLVAALVCLTTMTRMIEEERVQIGTLKALGYGNLTISFKYLIYGLLSSLLGAIIGLSIGFRLFPTAVMNAYGIMYNIPERLTPYHWDYAVISTLLAVITTMSASLAAALQELRSVPAVLMQVKAPKPGKRILLERITPLWRRLSFSRKVAARNIFRYKRRFFMTVIGIAGCTALLVTGFGLRDSVNDIMVKQFNELFTYDGQIFLDDGKDDSLELGAVLENYGSIRSYMRSLSIRVDVLVPNSSRSYEANLTVPEDGKMLEDYIHLHERVSRKKIPLKDRGAVITEKLSELLDVGVGDKIRFRDGDDLTFEVEIQGITENYLSHYIYLSPDTYEEISFKSPDFNTLLFTLKDPKGLDEKAFKEELMEHEGVLGIMLTMGLIDEVQDTLGSLDYVILILVLSAGALAFVVLYNLTNINITERIREIATLKVLGFRDREVSTYVYRENIILSVFGTMVGLLLGHFFHGYVIMTMEIDAMAFGKQIHPSSYLISILLTMVFSIMVNIFMHPKLRNVNMVESLKSNE